MKTQYVKSERAHFMCPNMHFGILAEVNAAFHFQKVCKALDTLADAHPFLKTTMRYEDGTSRLFYELQKLSTITVLERKNINSLWDDYVDISRQEWDIFQNGLLKVFLYPLKNTFKILFAAHHLLGDGRSILELASEFADLYVKDIKPSYTEENLIETIEDFPNGSDLSGISRVLVHRLNHQWKKEGCQVTYKEYTDFAEQFAKDNPTGFLNLSLDNTEVDNIKDFCRSNNVSVNDYLMAKLYTAADTPKIIIAADIRNKLSCYKPGAMGNYSTAMGIECKGKSKNFADKVKAVHKKVDMYKKDNRRLMLVLSCYLNMDETLIDAAAISSLGDFNSKAAAFAGGKLFGYAKRDGVSITNLGSITNPNIQEAVFIPPVSPAAKYIIGALTLNGKMQLVCGYYEKMFSKAYAEKLLECFRL